MKKRHITILGTGISLCILSSLINIYSIFRIICLILGIGLIITSLCLKRKRNIFYMVLISLILLTFFYGMDTLLFFTLNRVPVFSYEIKSSSKMRTFNSFFYRVFDCDGDMVLDYGYKKNYVCSTSLIESININSFLQDAETSFKKYHGKFVHIYGKISKITGNENIELASFTGSNNSLNGYVNFNLDNIVVVNVSDDLSKYRIYDYIDVFGLVDKKIDGKIILTDTLLVASNIYDDYSFEIILNNEKKLTNLVKEKDYYYLGITSVNIKYDQDNIYELSYLLLDDRIDFDDLTWNREYTTFIDEDEVVVAKKYSLDKFDIIKCSNEKIIVANTKVNVNDDVCELAIY